MDITLSKAKTQIDKVEDSSTKQLNIFEKNLHTALGVVVKEVNAPEGTNLIISVPDNAGWRWEIPKDDTTVKGVLVDLNNRPRMAVIEDSTGIRAQVLARFVIRIMRDVPNSGGLGLVDVLEYWKVHEKLPYGENVNSNDAGVKFIITGTSRPPLTIFVNKRREWLSANYGIAGLDYFRSVTDFGICP